MVESSASVPSAAEAPARVALSSEQIRSQQVARVDLGKKGMAELPTKGVDFSQIGKKTPSEIIEEINKRGHKWSNDSTTQEYVQETIDLQREIQIEELSIKSQRISSKEQPLDPKALADQAEKNVLERRIKDATPPEASTQPKTAEQVAAEKKTETDRIAAEKKAAEEKAEKEEQARITAEWVRDGKNPDLARKALRLIAAEEAVATVQRLIDKLDKAYQGAQTDRERKVIKIRYERAVKVRDEAQKMLAQEQKKLENMRKDHDAKDEDRLFAYDIDLAQTTANLAEAKNALDKAQTEVDTASPEEKPAAEAKRERVEAYKKSLDEKITTLNNERNNIGTPEKRAVNYVSAEVILLTKNVDLAKREPPDKDETADQRREAILKDPLGYVQHLIDTDPANLKAMLASGGISEKDQKKLQTIASAEAAMRTVRNKNVAEKTLGTGKTGLLALLLLIWTANVANKKAKGQQ